MELIITLSSSLASPRISGFCAPGALPGIDHEVDITPFNIIAVLGFNRDARIDKVRCAS